MSISVRTAAVTVRGTETDVTDPLDAEIRATPALTPVANPAWSMVATFVAFELQATLLVRAVVLPSEKIPLAVYACVWPVAIEAVAGATRIDCKRAELTATAAVPCLPLR